MLGNNQRFTNPKQGGTHGGIIGQRGNSQRFTNPKQGGTHGGIIGQRGNSHYNPREHDSFDDNYGTLIGLLKKAVKAYEQIQQAQDQNCAPTDGERAAHVQTLKEVKAAVLSHKHLVESVDQRRFLNRLQNLVYNGILPFEVMVSLSKALYCLSQEEYNQHQTLCGVRQRIHQLEALQFAESALNDANEWFPEKIRGCVNVAMQLMGPSGAIKRAIESSEELDRYETVKKLTWASKEMERTFAFLNPKPNVVVQSRQPANQPANASTPAASEPAAPPTLTAAPADSETAPTPAAEDEAPHPDAPATATIEFETAYPPQE